jgi:tRNA (cmo5U34)-methyltransferase
VAQFHWDPAAYLELMRAEVPDYEALQDALVDATRPAHAAVILELGTGTGETARRLLDAHADARLVGLDASADMLAAARTALAGRPAELHERRLQEPLPAGPYDLVASALAVHHLDGPGKAELFARIAPALRPGGRFVLADVVVPEDPADVVTPIDGDYDKPSGTREQLGWLTDAGLEACMFWARRDLAVLVADRPGGEPT